MAHFRTPSQVVHETLDGEVILINLENGNYYSLRGSGSDMWAMLAAGEELDSAARRLAELRNADGDHVAADLRKLADQLVEEGLLMLETSGQPSPAVALAEEGAYDPPLLERYTDMQDFILLDPVHDVGPEGWPQPAPK